MAITGCTMGIFLCDWFLKVFLKMGRITELFLPFLGQDVLPKKEIEMGRIPELILSFFDKMPNFVGYLKTQYKQARFGIVTNSPELVQAAKTLEFDATVLLQDALGRQEEVLCEVRGLLETGSQKRVDIVFCCLVRRRSGEEEPAAQYIHLMGAIADEVKGQRDLLRVLVAGYGDALSEEQQTLVEGLHSRHPAEVMGFQLPKQSCEIYECEVIRTQRAPLYVAYHHEGTTRRDEVAVFTEGECRKGCNGRVLAYHFLPELGFLLGRRPKYGA